MLGNLDVIGISLPLPSRPLLHVMSAHGGVIWEFQSDLLGREVKFTIGIINQPRNLLYYSSARAQPEAREPDRLVMSGQHRQSVQSPIPRPLPSANRNCIMLCTGQDGTLGSLSMLRAN